MSLLWKTAGRDEPEGLYHGTVRPLKPGDKILPADQRPSWHSVTFPSVTDTSYAYATSHDNAWDYAEKAHAKHFQPGSKIYPRVYHVKPLGPTEKDPSWDDHTNTSRGNWDSDVRSKHGFEVVREMPMPEHMGEPEDWR